MTVNSTDWYAPLLRCPDCGDHIKVAAQLCCASCSYQALAARDLRPSKPIPLTLQYSRLAQADVMEQLAQLDTSRPPDDFAGPLARRDSRALMRLIADRCAKGSKVLDLGCGPRDQAAPLQWLGYHYVGIDYSSPQADLLADAHCLPFQDEAFDCVFSYAVLEHLHQPFIAAHEINRVLKNGGIYIGTVSLGEPFHQSYFHHTPWGFLSLIGHATDLQPERLWASQDTLRSLSTMGRYPRVIRSVLKLVDFVHRKIPILAPRKMGWSQKEKELDALYRAGSVCFLCRKTDLKTT